MAVTALCPLVEYFSRANAETFVAIQIEHVDAVDDVEKIAAVPDVDLLFIGPADLSQSMGLPGQWDHPRLWQAIRARGPAAQAHGVHWAILPPNAAYRPALCRDWAAACWPLGSTCGPSRKDCGRSSWIMRTASSSVRLTFRARCAPRWGVVWRPRPSAV